MEDQEIEKNKMDHIAVQFLMTWISEIIGLLSKTGPKPFGIQVISQDLKKKMKKNIKK